MLKNILLIVLITVIALSTPISYSHHKDGHSGGPPDDKGKPDDVPKGPKDKNVGSGNGCNFIFITNNQSMYSRCVIIDTYKPYVQEVKYLGDMMCIKATDDIRVKSVYGIFISGAIKFEHWSGSYNWYCSNDYNKVELKYILVEDLADNRNIKMIL